MQVKKTFLFFTLIVAVNSSRDLLLQAHLHLILAQLQLILAEMKIIVAFNSSREGYYCKPLHLAIGSLSQIIWVFLFQSQLFALSVIAMVGILVPVILLYLRLGINLTNLSSPQRWLINFPISIYFAWISVATIVNIASALEIADWSGWGISPQVWTAIMMIVGAIIAVIVTWQRRDSIYGGVFVWALVALAFRQEENPTLAVIAGVLAGLLVLIISIRRKAEAKRKRI